MHQFVLLLTVHNHLFNNTCIPKLMDFSCKLGHLVIKPLFKFYIYTMYI